MKAAVCREPSGKLKIEDVKLAEPEVNEVLVKLVASGVCHSDLHFMKGEMYCAMPVVVGHEGAGIVEKVGANVTNVKTGQRVLIHAVLTCGHCTACRQGHENTQRSIVKGSYKGNEFDRCQYH